MKRRLMFFAVTASMPLLICSCAGKDKPEKTPMQLADFNGSEVQAQAVAAKFADGFASALINDDFSAWERVIPARFDRKITPEMFTSMRSDIVAKFGTPQRMEYITVLDQGVVRDYLWKLSFTTPAVPPALSQKREIIYWVRVFQEKGAVPEVGGFGFKPF